jgi:hypothetical protein
MYYMQQLKAAAKEIQQTKAAVNEAKTLNKSFGSTKIPSIFAFITPSKSSECLL